MTDAPKEARKRQAYWIAETVTPRMRARATLLASKGLEVRFFTALDSLIKELEARRTGILIVSDDGDQSRTERILITLTTMPEIQGARLVMIRSKNSEWLTFLAATGNVRDIIPENLDDMQWLGRFLFATASRAIPFVQPPGQITLANISALSIPARLTWISDGKLRVESKLRPPVGASLHLAGPLADSLGVSAVTLKVLSVERDRLLYRFSDAIVAEWTVPVDERARAMAVLKDLREQSTGPRCRVFIAASSLALRSQILEHFEDPRFEVSTALQKQSIVDEPRFFTPDVVMIEDKLCLGEDRERFEQMLTNLADHSMVAVVGNVPDLAEVQRRFPRLRLVPLARLPKTLTQSILARHGRASAPRNESGVAHVLSEHPYSLASLNIPARLTRIHPLAAQLSLPFPVTSFALCRIDSPLLRKLVGRSPYLKVTATYADTHPEAGAFPHIVEGYLADLGIDERRAVAGGLTKVLSDSLARIDAPDAKPPKVERTGNARTPELGSVRESGTSLPDNVVSLPPPPATKGQAASARTSESAQAPTPTSAPEATAQAAAQAAPPPSTGRTTTAGNAAVALGVTVGAKAAPDMRPISVDEQKLIPAREFADLIRPALAEAAEDIGREVTGYGQEIAKGVRKTVKKDYVVQSFTAVLVIGVVTLVLWITFRLMSPDWEKSGNVYTDQLRKFAPHLNRPHNP